MRWQMVRAIVGLESRLFLRPGKQSQFPPVVIILIFNALFGIIFFVVSINVVSAIRLGWLNVEFVFSYLLLIFNVLILLLLFFNTFSFLAICSRGEDIELLLPSPVTVGEVVAGKMIWNFLTTLFYMFIPLCGLIVPIGFVVGIVVALAALAAVILVMAAGSGLAGFLGCILLKLFKPTKIRERLLVIATVSSFLWWFIYIYMLSGGVSDLTDLLRHLSIENPLWYFSPATWATVFVLELYRGAVMCVLPIMGLGFMTFGIYLFGFKYAVKTYYSTVTEAMVVPRALKPTVRRFGYPLSFLRSVLGDASYSIFLNEARMTRRDTYRLLQIASMMVFVAIAFLPSVFSAPSPPPQAFPLRVSEFSFGMIGSWIPLMVGTVAIQSFGFEGQAFQLLKSAPVEGKRMVLGKLAFYLAVSIIPLAVILPTMSVVFHIDLAYTLTVLSSSILGCIGALGFSMYVGVSWPEFEKVVTGFFGSQRRGVSVVGSLVYVIVVTLYFIPNMVIVGASSLLKLPIGLIFIPATIILVIGIVALNASFRKAEELEVT